MRKRFLKDLSSVSRRGKRGSGAWVHRAHLESPSQEPFPVLARSGFPNAEISNISWLLYFCVLGERSAGQLTLLLVGL